MGMPGLRIWPGARILSWFRQTYAVEMGLLSECDRCDEEIVAYGPAGMRVKKRKHKKICRKRLNAQAREEE